MSDTRKEPYPEATASDARSAIIRAARRDGTTCCAGAFKARRTIKEHDPNMKPRQTHHIVRLRLRDSNEIVGDYPVVPFGELRNDWSRPSPCEPGEVVLPSDEYDIQSVFKSAKSLPGSGER